MNPDGLPPLPSFDDIEAAAARLSGQAAATPLHENAALNEIAGGRVLLKCENLQRTGSFKFRGAFNRISLIPQEDRKRGVVAYSSGNHAQGVAAAAALFGIKATIVMPADAPRSKIENTERYGAEIVLYDREDGDRYAIADALVAKTGATLVRPFDDPAIIAGQGTCGLEAARQAAALGAQFDAFVVCFGGGGLTAGCALAMEGISPNTEILIAEPIGFDEGGRSFSGGKREPLRKGASSICDALLSEQGKLTYEINRTRVSGGLAVNDEEVLRAIAFAFRTLKLVIEPGGAVCLAAVLAGKMPTKGRTVGLTLSGGNIDDEMMRRALCL